MVLFSGDCFVQSGSGHRSTDGFGAGDGVGVIRNAIVFR